MSLILSFKSEILKTRRTAVRYLCIGAAAILPLMTLLFDYGTPEGIAELKPDPWNIYFKEGAKGLGVVLLPFFIVLISTLLPQLEYRNNTWKQLLTSPQSKANVMWSKFLTIQFFIIWFFIFFNVYQAITLMLLNSFKGSVDLYNHSLSWSKFLLSNGKIYLAVVAMSAIQFWVGIRFKNFIAPIAIGFGLWIAAMTMIAEFHWIHANKFPFAFPMLSVFTEMFSFTPMLWWLPPVYAVLFISLTFWELRRGRIRG